MTDPNSNQSSASNIALLKQKRNGYKLALHKVYQEINAVDDTTARNDVIREPVSRRTSNDSKIT